jgi:hypothetical protein
MNAYLRIGDLQRPYIKSYLNYMSQILGGGFSSVVKFQTLNTSMTYFDLSVISLGTHL